jgi:hypothetical protein
MTFNLSRLEKMSRRWMACFDEDQAAETEA